MRCPHCDTEIQPSWIDMVEAIAALLFVGSFSAWFTIQFGVWTALTIEPNEFFYAFFYSRLLETILRVLTFSSAVFVLLGWLANREG